MDRTKARGFNGLTVILAALDGNTCQYSGEVRASMDRNDEGIAPW
jgi:hypothetical protein